MNPADLLRYINSKGVRIYLSTENHITAKPSHFLTDELRLLIKNNKKPLVALLLHKREELNELVNQVSAIYGNDEGKWLTEYINDILLNNDVEHACTCFRDLAKQVFPVNYRK